MATRYKTYRKSDYPFELLAAAGSLPGITTVDKFGRNPSVTANTLSDIWDGGGIWVAPTQARQHNLSSTSSCDTNTACGAWAVTLFGLDQNYGTASETASLNGSGSVLTTGSYVIIYRMSVASAGGDKQNVGVVTATAETDNTITAQIAACVGQTQMAIYQVPASCTGFMTRYYNSMLKSNQSGGADFSIQVITENGVKQTRLSIGAIDTGNSQIEHNFDPPKKFTEKEIIKAQVSASANNVDISAGFDLLIIDNT